ncbi:GroES-like protein [Colletotrichum zoysiae]|uniref:GroES-like protein n=1 Tax=Colletotrichum zoysiae TaxID=1216348 RepID=A0AAD9HHJ1_9PEZI|nr:GroES-like protein [Colletotrichum zoysiae]
MTAKKILAGNASGEYEINYDAPMPTIRPHQMLCKTDAVALNPMNSIMKEQSPNPGVGGYEFSGTVVQVGTSVTRFKPGDKVFGLVHGLKPDDRGSGAFTDHVIATADLCCEIPVSTTDPQASTLPLALGAVGYAASKLLGLATPGRGKKVGDKPEYVLIAGADSLPGRLATQLFTLSGIKPVVTCSSNARMNMKDLGAVEAFDHQSKTCGREIKNFTRNTLAHVLDCASSEDAMAICFEALGSRGGRYVGLDAPSTRIKYTRRDVSVDWVQVPPVLAEL